MNLHFLLLKGTPGGGIIRLKPTPPGPTTPGIRGFHPIQESSSVSSHGGVGDRIVFWKKTHQSRARCFQQGSLNGNPSGRQGSFFQGFQGTTWKMSVWNPQKHWGLVKMIFRLSIGWLSMEPIWENSHLMQMYGNVEEFPSE